MDNRLGRIHDVRDELARSARAIASLTALPAGRNVASHVHTNPYLALHVLGSYRDRGDCTELSVDGPAALFFPAGSAHEMTIGQRGLATVIIEFDGDALRHAVVGDLKRPRFWVGGEVGRHASRLAHSWLALSSERRRFDRTVAFLNAALSATPSSHAPSWLCHLERLLEAENSTANIERWVNEIGVTRPWLVRGYRYWRGEGLEERMLRRRVEAAAILLERRELGLAEIAARAGFCDQSHMNRAFRKFLGRTPARTRAARLGLARKV